MNPGKVIDADLHKLFEEIEKLTESMNKIVAKDKKLPSDLVIVQNVNCRLEAKIIYLKKKQATGEQYSCRKNTEISDISNNVSGNDLESTMVNICKDSGVGVDGKDIKSCQQLPLSRNSKWQDERVIEKFVNQ